MQYHLHVMFSLKKVNMITVNYCFYLIACLNKQLNNEFLVPFGSIFNFVSIATVVVVVDFLFARVSCGEADICVQCLLQIKMNSSPYLD